MSKSSGVPDVLDGVAEDTQAVAFGPGYPADKAGGTRVPLVEWETFRGLPGLRDGYRFRYLQVEGRRTSVRNNLTTVA